MSTVPSPTQNKLKITFVCTGNICRSPMGDVILNSLISQEGLTDQVCVNSCGIGGWHVGQKADRRTIAELENAGYDGNTHRAAQLGDQHDDADLFIALDHGHFRDLTHYGIPPEKIRLLRSFDPAVADSDEPQLLDVEDPYYGDLNDFRTARIQIEQAMPGILQWIKENLATTA